MSQRINTRNRRGFTYLWIAGLATLVFILLWKEQTALLYILATLGVTALLVVVALADLDPSGEAKKASVQTSGAPAADVTLSSRSRGKSVT